MSAAAAHPLADARERLDAIDRQLLELLQARNRIIGVTRSTRAQT